MQCGPFQMKLGREKYKRARQVALRILSACSGKVEGLFHMRARSSILILRDF
jgi:hypothetical protein